MNTNWEEWGYIRTIMARQRMLPGIEKKKEKEKIPLSYAQQRLWIIQEVDASNYAYNMFFPFSVEGRIDLDVFDEAVNEVIARYEILRTTFEAKDGEPYQIVHGELKIRTIKKDFDGEKEKAFSWILDQTKIPFDLKKLPLIKTYQGRIDENRSYLLILLHHIIGDAEAMNIVLKEIRELYECRLYGSEARLAEPDIQFSDYAVWEKENYTPFLEERMAYWLKKLPKQIQPLNLLTDKPRPLEGTFHGNMVPIPFTKELYSGLGGIRKKFPGVTLFMIIAAAYRVLLYRYTGEPDILIGCPMANRMRKDTKKLVGYLANMVVLYTQVDENATFGELLSAEKQTCLEAYENQDFPYEYLLNKIAYKREMNRNPLFQTAITFQDVAEEELKLGDALARVEDVQREAAMFDILMLMYDNGESINGWFEYSTDLFHETTAVRLAGHFCVLLKQIIEDPDIPIREIELATEEETKQICAEWNATDHEYSNDLCLHELFEKRAAECGTKTALITGELSMTYEDLERRSNQLAWYLLELTEEREQIIGICIHDSFEMVVGVLAILKAGCTYVPLDPDLPDERIGFMLKDCGVEITLTKKKYTVKLASFKGTVVCLDDEKWKEYPCVKPEVKTDAESLAYVIYTSGTTGVPKGVMVRHQSVVNVIEWVNRTFQVKEEDRLLLTASIGFDLSVYDMFGLLAAGGSIYIPDREQVREPERLLDIIKSCQITFWDSAPAVFLQLFPSLGALGQCINSLRLVFLSGDWIPVELPAETALHFPNAVLVALGGATEASIWSNYYITDPKEQYWDSIPYGRPIQNCRYYILDDHGKLCPVGVEGNLYIGGVCLAAGYWNQPELTRARFIEDHAGWGNEKLYVTGDRARYLQDGKLQFLGRKDTQVKIRGFRIELEEIRHVLETHPYIISAVVLAEGENSSDKRLAAFFVPDREWPQYQTEIQDYLKRKLPQYMIPWTCIPLSAIPYGTNGKVKEDRLRELLTEYVPKELCVKAETKLQKDLLFIWREIIKNDQIGIDTDFFDAGGHSLLAAKLTAAINERLGLDVLAKDIFRSSTVRNLEKYIIDGNEEQQFIRLEEEAAVSLEEAEYAFDYRGRKKNFFLTGCTGFIGRFLLYELLTTSDAAIYCLLNQAHEGDEEPYSRLKRILMEYELWQPSFAKRLIPVRGNLKEKNLGIEKEQYRKLAQEIDVIYHNGAVASYLDHYHTLKASNVNGTKEVVKFAALFRKKPVHFSSTITVFNADDDRVIHEDTCIQKEKHEYYPGYFASKWVAEEVINQARACGIPCNIYRFGLMTGDTEKGRYDSRQWMYQLHKSFLLLGYGFGKMPDFDHAVLPVDTAVKMVCQISYQDELLNRNYFICNPNRVPVQGFVKTYSRVTGYPVSIVDFYDWLRIAEAYMEEHDDLVIYYFVQHLAHLSREELAEYINNDKRKLDINAERTRQVITELGIQIPEFDESLIMKNFEYIVSHEPELKKRMECFE